MARGDDALPAGGGEGEGDEDLGGPPPDRVLRVTRTCVIPADELTWRFTTSSGPGGQHANRSHTVAEVAFDAQASPSLGPRQRARILEALGPVVMARAADERSQARNRQLALERLRSRLAGALVVTRPRVPTKPSPAARERRLRAKHHRSDIKQLRKAPDE
ncbi:MAG TPA: alternative ribosome rescue aminoacyl-tRNA hydrolase ArfB [Acidimicrobiales bacterium]|nr:alternative ribosome rescue aminoacyl-tRNA hydrolase ArfB [Acidimicrobiales bacterium]